MNDAGTAKSVWQLQGAKNQFSLVVGQALTQGPQTITRHGKPTVVMLAAGTCEGMKPRRKTVEVLRACPAEGLELARVVDWLDQHDAQLHVSVITQGEILKGINLLSKGRKQHRLETWFADLEASFEGRILLVDPPVMREWAALYARHQRAGRLLSSFDSLLAATASLHGLTLVTRNGPDFPPEVP